MSESDYLVADARPLRLNRDAVIFIDNDGEEIGLHLDVLRAVFQIGTIIQYPNGDRFEITSRDGGRLYCHLLEDPR